MKGRILTKALLERFREHLILEERSEATIEKYCRDVYAFTAYADGAEITKELVIAYKQTEGRRLRRAEYKLYAGKYKQSFRISRVARSESKIDKSTTTDILLGGKGTDESGVYAARQYGESEAQRAPLPDPANDLRHRYPRERVAIHHRGSRKARRSDDIMQGQNALGVHRS